VLQKKERKQKIDSLTEIQPEHNDSFEKFYNKDLDLEEGKNFSAALTFVIECRLGARRYLRAVRISNKLHFLGIVRKGTDPASESPDDARVDPSA
jgi:hypothetical protein